MEMFEEQLNARVIYCMFWKRHFSASDVTFWPLFFQAGDAGDPVLLDAPTVSAGGVEESDRHVRNSALPQHGKGPVLHSSEDHRELKRTPLCPCGETNAGQITVKEKGWMML